MGNCQVILKLPEDFVTRVYDSTGKELRHCIWCNTETGEAVHYKLPLRHTIDHTGGISIATEWRYHKAPLIYERIINERQI